MGQEISRKQVRPLSILAFLIVFGIVSIVHELGHFLTAKFFDVGVLKFSL
ncbi:MAG TPA: site-2 protease family protein, partial [Bacillota bacterium]|nr:site-2 protease family protein [Bacillota bacterium]